MQDGLRISILVDNPRCWIIPFAREICSCLSGRHLVKLYFEASEVPLGDLLFVLGCTSVVSGQVLAKNTRSLVVHESELPNGRGWSPATWQILEGKNTIPIVLFEASEKVDSGPIYLRDRIELDGTELLPEIKRKQGEKTVELVCRFVDAWPDISGEAQEGTPTYYRKRSEKDDELDPTGSIVDNFNLLRVAHNEEHPAWFRYQGKKYILKIYEAKED